ncbi:hypothetical protein [Cellulomonas sp. ATA003]|uniref:hypothetical protein n=1 Tax=Cellulomonas sp. ATA003 TaxID=3073064 RepID=UPI002873E54C|nr:hypothetical protein [Cellulomonas sp. ATA003]WNB86268.1 hypothetical protein REH70_03125 [Cellulomonas sp. ATA003]
MSTPVDRQWPSAQDQAWADRVLWRVVVREGAPAAVADVVLAEARAACREAGRPAVELFGDADAYAAAVARDRVPEGDRAGLDLDGSSPRDGWTLWLLTTGWTVSVLGVVLLVVDGWSVTVTGWGLAVVAATVGLGTGALWGHLERGAGRVRRGWVWWGAGIAALVAALGVGTLVDDRPAVAELPTPLLLVAGVVLVVVGFARPESRPEPEVRPTSVTPQQWFDGLAGLLRGRYHLPRAEVARQVSDARAHWLDAGSDHPGDEFGTAAAYALRLMEGSPLPRQGRRRQRAWLYTAATVFWCAMVLDAVLTAGIGWRLAWTGAGLAVVAAAAATEWRAVRRGDAPV